MPPRTIHILKTWPGYFGPILDGTKTFEVRNLDRDFRVGDVLVLQEWEPASKEYTGRATARTVTYIMGGQWGIDQRTVVMALGPVADGLAEVLRPLVERGKEKRK
jgi:hypothetical protein